MFDEPRRDDREFLTTDLAKACYKKSRFIIHFVRLMDNNLFDFL